MSQTTLQGPDSKSKLPNTRDETSENGWSFKSVIDAINTMFTELYANETARAALEAAETATKFVDVTVSSGELLALNATPKELVAAPGANYALIFEGAIARKAAGTAYAGVAAGEDLSVKYTNGSGAEVAQCEVTGFLDQSTAQIRYVRPQAAASGNSAITPVANAALVLHMLSGEITTGNTSLVIRVYYRVVPTATP